MAAKAVYVGSKNPVKLAAMKAAFLSSFPTDTFEFIAVDAPSGVPDQPMGDAQTLEGARNRVAHLRAAHPTGAFFAGIEGGCERLGAEMFCSAWMVVNDGTGLEGKAKAGTFFLPNAVTALVDAGDELGTAVDKIFNRHNSKQGSGAVGSLTGNLVTRQTYYERPCVMALIPFLNRNMYTDAKRKAPGPADDATRKANLSVLLSGVATAIDVAALQAHFGQHGPVRKVIRLAARSAKGASANDAAAGNYAAIVIYAEASSAAAALAAAAGGTVELALPAESGANPAGVSCTVNVTEGPSRKKLKKGC